MALWGSPKAGALPSTAQLEPVTEVHPGISDFAQVKKVTDFLAALELSEQDRHSIPMGALDTGIIQLPISKLILPNFARSVSAEKIQKEVQSQVGRAMYEIESEMRRRGHYF